MKNYILGVCLLGSIMTFGQVQPNKVKFEGKALKELTANQKAINNPEELEKLLDWMVRNEKILVSDNEYQNRLQKINDSVSADKLKGELTKFYDTYISVCECLRKIY